MTASEDQPNARPTIVVGWDGSAASRAAMAAAARLARGGRLVAVHAHEAIAPHVTTRWQEHAARDHGADGIAVGTRGIGSSSADTGSVSSELLRSAGRPVLVIPPAALAHPQES